MKRNEPNQDPDGSQAGLSAKICRGDVFAVQCPSRDVLKHVTSRWGVLILIALLGGTHRFSDLRRKIRGVSEKMLAQTLQWLENDGFVLRCAFPVQPPHVEYSLTPLGVEVAQRVESLADWIEMHIQRILDGKSVDQTKQKAHEPSACPQK